MAKEHKKVVDENEPEENVAEKDTIELSKEQFEVIQLKIGEMGAALETAQETAQKEKARGDEFYTKAARLQADFDNYRKRNTEAAKRLKEDGVAEVLEKIVPVIDVVDQALKMIEDEKVAEGVRLIGRQLSDLVASFGVEEIAALGEQFDPNFHNAVMQVAADNADEENVIKEVYHKGYKMGERIIRHSVVKVAK